MFPRRNLLLLLAGAVVFFSSVVCGAGSMPSAAPQATADANQPAAPAQPAATPAAAGTEAIVLLPTATAGAPAPAPAIPESRRLTLEYPGHIRVGDSDIVRLTLEVDTLGNVTPTAETAGNLVVGQTVQVPNLYDTHNVIAEARLDLAGVDIRPGDAISEPLSPGQSATFYWSVHPPDPGTYRGTVWLFLRFIDKATLQESRIPLSAQTIQISSSDFLGLSGGLARTAGSVGSVIGGVLGFPFVSDVLKWFWKRVRHAA